MSSCNIVGSSNNNQPSEGNPKERRAEGEKLLTKVDTTTRLLALSLQSLLITHVASQFAAYRLANGQPLPSKQAHSQSNPSSPPRAPLQKVASHASSSAYNIQHPSQSSTKQPVVSSKTASVSHKQNATVPPSSAASGYLPLETDIGRYDGTIDRDDEGRPSEIVQGEAAEVLAMDSSMSM